ncbi:flagellar basal body-associated protein FliL [Ahrensia sp. R2A130]|nr:flagellar basal body-associated protein FliL [Ahrensia sp. R2A130]
MAAEKKKGGVLGTIIMFVMVTAIGAGMGFGGLWFQGQKKVAVEPEIVAKGEKPEPATLHVHDLQPILTNIAAPKDVWVRLELSLLTVDAIDAKLAEEIGQDLFALMRTIRLDQMEGPSGFLALRHAIDQRAKFRGGEMVERVLFRTLVLE